MFILKSIDQFILALFQTLVNRTGYKPIVIAKQIIYLLALTTIYSLSMDKSIVLKILSAIGAAGMLAIPAFPPLLNGFRGWGFRTLFIVFIIIDLVFICLKAELNTQDLINFVIHGCFAGVGYLADCSDPKPPIKRKQLKPALNT